MLCLLFNLIGASGAFAAPEEAQRVPQKNNLVADIGEIPNTLPKEKLELTSKRTKYSTRFLNPDGSFTEEIFLEPKFYQDPADKKWKNIDNKLKTKTSGKYENGANDFNAIFAGNSEAGELVTVEKDGKSVAFVPVQADNVTGSINQDKITYAGLFQDTDVRYQVKGDSVKEDLILKKYNNKNVFSYELKLSGITASVESDGTIIFQDNKGNKLWYFEKPFMTDASGKYSDKVTLTLRKENGKSYVDVTADKTFLEDPSTQYPVTIDPTIDSWNILKDTFISGTSPNSSYSSATSMHTGNTPSYGAVRSLAQFYLPALPSESKISSANFNAYQSRVESTNVSVDLFKITSNWTGSVTWNTQPTINATPESTVTSNVAGAYWQWDITQLTKDLYNGVVPNYGFMLKQQNEGTSPYRSFNTVNASTNTPRLTINYTIDPIGLEDFWGYTNDGVNPANGNLILQQNDFSIPGRGVPVSIDRTYNSRKSAIAGIFGYGWKSNVEAQLVDSGNGPITLIDGDNTRHIFGQAVGGGYVAAGGVYLTLVKNGDNTYTVTQTDGTRINFNTSGKISSIVDTNNNTTTYSYTSGKLTTITDASGRTTTIAYGANGYVSSITYNPANRTVSYEYDASYNLTKVTDPAAKFITMGYDSGHNMTTITDQRNTTTTIGYDVPNDRVTSISRPISIDGVVQTSTTNYSYYTAYSVTSVIDGEGRRIDYSYNSSKNIVQIAENPQDTANKSVTTYAYNNNNNLTQVKDANVNKTENYAYAFVYTYDGNGNITSVTPPAQQSNPVNVYVYTYDANGNVTGVQLPENQSEINTYDSQNNRITSRDFNLNTSKFSYDGSNNQTEFTDPYTQTAASSYLSNGNLDYSTNMMAAADNLLANSSFELDAEPNSWPDNWTQAVESGKTATFAWSGTAKYGNKGVSISNPTGWAIVTSDFISATATDKFIVSGYVKTSGTTSNSLIKIDFYNSSNGWISQQISYGLKGTHDWTRVQAVVDSVPAGTEKIKVSAGMDPGTGTAYFDGIQLEKGTVLSAYNLLDNSSFERDANADNYPDNWDRGALTTSDVKDSAEKHIGSFSYKITGQSGVNKSIKQRINISGDANTKLTLSGWSKQSGASPSGGNYLMQVAIHYTSGSTDWDNANTFSKTASGWQHVAAVVNPTAAFDWIEVYYYYYNQTGTAWFDAPRLEIGPSHTFNTYDANGNYVASVKDPLGNIADYTYDTFGNVLTAEDPKNQTTSFQYDSRNLLTQVTDAKNGITTYGYDNAGNRTTVTDARNKTTAYEYNEFNQISRITNPLSQAIQFGYNKNGQNTKVIFPKGDSITSSYNALNRLNGVSYNGIQKWGYTYDSLGNVTSINNIAAGKTTDYTYDKNNRVTRLSEGANNRFDYGYDNNSNLTSLTLTAGAASATHGYTYDSLNQVTALSRNSSNLVKFIYDERGNVISARYSNGTYIAYEYDADNRLTLVKNYNAAGAVLDSYAYTYDANSNRTSVVTGSGTISYQYDALNQLTQETLLDGTTITYEYDAAGNRTKKTVGANVTNYTYDNGNQLTAVNGQTYTYDSNGNRTSNGPKTYVYNEVNQLVEVKNTGGSTIATFTYDDQGKRISMTVSGSTSNFHYSGDNVVYVTDGNNTVTAEYTWDAAGKPVTMTYNGATYYYHLDGHGSVTKMTDTSGNTVAQYQYDAWGNILSQSGTMASVNPYRYSGYRYDEATGLYYLMARYYDANIGRFITRDSFHGFENDPQSLNQYVYCENNPIMLVDPSGHFAVPNWLIERGIDIAILVYTGGSALVGYLAVKTFIKNNRGVLTRVLERQLFKFIGSKTNIIVTTLMQIILTAVDLSVGKIVAKILDNYIDPRFGFKKGNGWSFG